MHIGWGRPTGPSKPATSASPSNAGCRAHWRYGGEFEDLPLTGREKQLCLLLAHARSRQDLADAMGVSTGTVITHQGSIYAKLGVHSRAELVASLLPG